MARFISTTFGKISGRHGNAVAVTTKDGRCFLRVYTKPKDPTTPKQLAHQAKFGLVSKELSCLGTIFKITFNDKRGKNKAVSLAYKNCIVGEYPNFTLDYSKMIFTVGNLDITGRVTATVSGGTTIKLEWESSVFSHSNPNDTLNLVFFNESSKKGLLKHNLAERTMGSVFLEMPAIWAGAQIHCWLYFTSQGGINSPSQYVSLIQL